MKKILIVGALLAACSAASAQSPIIQSGSVTPGHAWKVITNGVAGDAGTAANGSLTSLGVTASGPALCQNSGPVTGPYNQLCFSPTGTGGGFSWFNYGGATGTPTFNINGTLYPFFGSGTGNVLGPSTTTPGCLAPWANTTGTLLGNNCIFSLGTNTVTMPSTAGYWNPGYNGGVTANFARLNDRLVLGKTTNLYGGDYNDSSETWVSTEASGQYAYLERNGQFLNYSTYGEMAATFASRTSDNANLPGVSGSTCCSMALALFGMNDNTASVQSSWTRYETMLRLPGTGTIQDETDVFNATNAVVVVGPYIGIPTGATVGQVYSAGGEGVNHTTYMSPSSAAIFIGGNGETWDTGIVCGVSVISNTNPACMKMSQNILLEWVTGQSGNLDGIGGFVSGQVNATADANGLVFSNFGALFMAGNTSGAILAQINLVASSVNYPILSPSATGNPVELSANGSDTNVSLELSPKGSGVVGLTSNQTITSGNAQTEYIQTANSRQLYVGILDGFNGVFNSAGGGNLEFQIGGTTYATISSAGLTIASTASFAGQIVGTYGTPTIASGACGATTNGTLASGATNQFGEVIIGAATTTSCTIAFSATLGAAPLACILFPGNAQAATELVNDYVSAITTAYFVITGTALANTDYYYHCV